MNMTSTKKPSPGKTATARPRRNLGRPVGVSNVREEILDAAEIDFGDRGYAGTSLREIAAATNVTQALITYYFGSKQQLFEQVFLRRALHISSERMRLLDELQGSSPAVGLRDIVRTFLLPMLDLRKTRGGRAFIRLHARLHTEPPEISYPLRSQAYDASMRAYIDAIQQALPTLAATDVYWRVTLMVGAYLYAFSDAHRLEVLSAGQCDPNDDDELQAQLLNFIVGGLQAEGTGAAAPQAASAPGRKVAAKRKRA